MIRRKSTPSAGSGRSLDVQLMDNPMYVPTDTCSRGMTLLPSLPQILPMPPFLVQGSVVDRTYRTDQTITIIVTSD